ncbi:aldolase [Paenibacillus cremeus]|uniref:Aldolase n=1 Tax=Paenibacillus cremeus TaxID=2163881 RepID=A0A559K0K5_9BACL|nr:aldolase [Paenibacillus cremeus]TVY05626.1 aldolase [Paenibacillus cremeus]
MIEVEKRLIYKAFGLFTASEISLPELSLNIDGANSIDVCIEYGDLNDLWKQRSEERSDFLIDGNMVVFRVENIGIFAIQDGKKITVSPIQEPDEDIIRLFVLGTCMGAILMQRRTLPLHGSAIAFDGKAYAIVGDSGAGKSTLATAFLNKGYQLLTDDVIAITQSEDCVPYVIPSYPQQKLWQDSLMHFGMESSGFRPLFQRETKYSIPVSTQFSTESLPLAGIFELVKTEDQQISIKQLSMLERFHTLYEHTYRNFIINRLGLIDWHFRTSANILNQLLIFNQIRRPTSGFSAPQLAELIISSINKGE